MISMDGLLVVVVVVAAVFFIGSFARILREYERAVIFRLGRSARAILNPGGRGNGPGLVLMVPFIDKMVKVSLQTVALDVPPKVNSVQVQHTLLGVELKIGRRRMLCPDLATARYLGVFARAGCVDVAVPYDITKISRLADELESAWHRMLLLIEREAAERHAAFRSRARTLLIMAAREEITQAGAGTAIPQFNQNTKQRRAQ